MNTPDRSEQPPEPRSALPAREALPEVGELLAASRVVRLPLAVPFRGLTEREALIFEGPYGWGEFAPFVEYDDTEAARWLAAGLEAAWQPPVAVVRDRVPVNATVPAVAAEKVDDVLARFEGCTTAKVKVAQRGQSLRDDVNRVAAVRSRLGPTGKVRVDANGAWDVEAAADALAALSRYDLEYAEQPCASLDELVALRRRLAAAGIDVPVAVDESVRRAEDPLRVAVAGAADVVVIKVAPLGGVRSALQVAQQLGRDHGLPVVVSSALDTSVGLAAGVRLAAALPELRHACGLGTAALLERDVTSDPLRVVAGDLPVRSVPIEAAWLDGVAADEDRTRWWRERLSRSYKEITFT